MLICKGCQDKCGNIFNCNEKEVTGTCCMCHVKDTTGNKIEKTDESKVKETVRKSVLITSEIEKIVKSATILSTEVPSDQSVLLYDLIMYFIHITNDTVKMNELYEYIHKEHSEEKIIFPKICLN